jgi:hypothetical protein
MKCFKRLCFLSLIGIALGGCLRKEEKENPSSEEPTVYTDSLQNVIGSEQSYKVGQTVYVPVYSEIYFMDDKSKILLGVTLSIHNTDPDSNLVVTKVDYYNSQGKLLTHYLKQPGLLKPLQTKDFVVDLTDREGGTGANFLVEWRSEHQVSEPLIETIMISISNRGVSFVSRGKVVRQLGKPL